MCDSRIGRGVFEMMCIFSVQGLPEDKGSLALFKVKAVLVSWRHFPSKVCWKLWVVSHCSRSKLCQSQTFSAQVLPEDKGSLTLFKVKAEHVSRRHFRSKVCRKIRGVSHCSRSKLCLSVEDNNNSSVLADKTQRPLRGEVMPAHDSVPAVSPKETLAKWHWFCCWGSVKGLVLFVCPHHSLQHCGVESGSLACATVTCIRSNSQGWNIVIHANSASNFLQPGSPRCEREDHRGDQWNSESKLDEERAQRA